MRELSPEDRAREFWRDVWADGDVTTAQLLAALAAEFRAVENDIIERAAMHLLRNHGDHTLIASIRSLKTWAEP